MKKNILRIVSLVCFIFFILFIQDMNRKWALNFIFMSLVIGVIFYLGYVEKKAKKENTSENIDENTGHYEFENLVKSLSGILIEITSQGEKIHFPEGIKKSFKLKEDIEFNELLGMLAPVGRIYFEKNIDRLFNGKEVTSFGLSTILYLNKNERKHLSVKGNGYFHENGEYSISVLMYDITKEIEEHEVSNFKAYDEVTGLINLDYFKEKAQKVIENMDYYSQNIALIFVDIDNLKYINDRLGSEISDKVLKHIGESLGKQQNFNTIVGKYSEEKFIILKKDPGEQDKITAYIKELVQHFNKCINIDGNDVYVNISIGMAMYPTDGDSLKSVLNRASIALFSSKSQGKNKFTHFNTTILEAIQREYSIVNGLRDGMKDRELFLVMQPKVRISDEGIEGFECLVRWSSKKLGNVAPKEFIPMAESSSLIEDIGKYIIIDALKKCREMINEINKPFRLAINLSELQLRDEGLFEFIKDETERFKIDPKYIEFEITESILVKSLEKNIELFKKLREKGFTIALDDFGTGYSSLNYLNVLPVDVIKMDKSFIDGIGNDKKSEFIISTIINLSHNMKIKVVAEGVENKEQLEFLKKCQCDYIQGYIYSKPQIYENALEMLKTGKVCIGE